MPFRCCVPNCRSGYGAKQSHSTHLFRIHPDDWIAFERSIPRSDFRITTSTRICSLHFTDDCLSWVSVDTNPRRSKVSKRKPRLIRGRLPTLFPNCPFYLSRREPLPRSSTLFAEARRGDPGAPEDEVLAMLDDTDRIENLKDLLIRDHTNCSYCFRNEMLHIFMHDSKDTRIFCEIRITMDMSYELFFLGAPMTNKFEYLLSRPGKITYFTEIDNLIAKVRSYVEDNIESPYLFILHYLNGLKTDDEFLNFIHEQLILKNAAPKLRRYSSNLYTLAYFWRNCSTACYKLLGETLVLPSLTQLNRLTSNIPSSANSEYLKLRCSNLDDTQKTCILMIDEVYTAEKLELDAKGHIVGVTSESELAKTVLAFMIKSIRSDFSEMISLIPVRNLTANEIKKHFDEVMSLLKDYVLIVAISVDNHVINRKFYDLLRAAHKIDNESSRVVIRHPYFEQESLFLLSDTTHCLKNVFNNFHIRETLRYPTEDGSEKARFSDLKAIFHMESSQSLRRAHKLTAEILNPTSTSKVSPKYALGKCSHILIFLKI